MPLELDAMTDDELKKSFEELRDRIEDLEKNRFRQGVYAGAVGLILVATLGITFVQLPGKAREAANAQLPDLVTKEAQNTLPNLVSKEAENRLPKLVDTEAKEQLPKLLDSQVPPVIDRIVKERTADFEGLRQTLLRELISVSQRTATVEVTIDRLESQAQAIEDQTNALAANLKDAQDTDYAKIAGVIGELKKAPKVEDLLQTQRDHGESLKSLEAAASRHAMRFIIGHVRVTDVPNADSGGYRIDELEGDVYKITFDKPFASRPAVCVTVARNDQSSSAGADNTVRVDTFSDHCLVYLRDLTLSRRRDGQLFIDSQGETADFGFFVAGRD